MYILSIFAAISLLVIIELLSFLLLKFYYLNHGRPTVSIDRQDILREYGQIKYIWQPYTGFTVADFKGKYFNVFDHRRKTINYCGDESSTQIFVFGGSSVWGDFVRDDETLPTKLSKRLCSQRYDVNIINYGLGGYNSNQEVISLLMELRRNNVPDIVIFYDGINDVWATYQSGEVGYPHNAFKRETEFGSYDSYKMRLFNFSKIILSFITSPSWEYKGNLNISKDIVDNYEHNIRVIKSLSEEYGFKVYFIWQPSLLTKEPKTEYEIKRVEKDYTSTLRKITIDSNKEIKRVVDNKQIFDFSDIFEGINNTLYYIDSYHVYGGGNEIIAKKISDIIKEDLK